MDAAADCLGPCESGLKPVGGAAGNRIMFKRILIWSGVFLGIVVLVAVVLLAWRDRVIKERSLMALERVESSLSNATPREALAMINARPPSGGAEESEDRWFAVEVEASARLGLVARLQTLHSQRPDQVLANEDASLILARAFLHGDDEAKGLAIAVRWESRSTRPALWFAYRVDAALLNGRRAEAIRLLSEAGFDGPDDSLRLSRLALLTAGTDLPEAWNLLAAAYAANPRDKDVRSFRGQILEGLGSNRLARVEYVAAHVADPGNLLMRDQLAEYYRRHGNYLNALDTWLPALTNSPPAYVHLKARFWSRVTRPTTLPPFEVSTADPLGELVNHLDAVDTKRFWSADDFELLAGRSNFERTRQEVFWLRMLELLREGKRDSALELLRTNPFRGRGYDPLLDRSLYAVLSWRKLGRLDAYGVDFPALNDVTNRHSFLVGLDKFSRLERAARRTVELPEELRVVLGSDSAPALVFLASGWLRAALDSGAEVTWPDGTPGWIPFAVTQAVRLVRGVKPALAYAANQPPSPELNLLIGELQLADGQADTGLNTLATLAPTPGPVGYRAAWLAASALLERGEHERAAAIVNGQTLLKGQSVGQELLARSALARGETNVVEEIYSKIVSGSVEAKAYLARLAFARKEWRRARELTEELLMILPDEMALRRNLEAIAAAEKASK